MYIALKDNKIVQAASTLEEITAAVQFLVYDSIEETDGVYKLHDKTGEFLTLEEIEAREREELDRLSLTKREVFLALYEDKGITPEQLKAQITDDKALIEFEYANEYYRGNPLIDLIGAQLGYTSAELDYLFKNKTFEGFKNDEEDQENHN